MTVYTWARPRRFPRLPAPRPRYFDVADDARVLAHCYWQPAPRACPTVLALHGLEGSSSAHYMRGLADKAWAAGCNVVLLNQRNCGGTEALSARLYHSGLTHDPGFVVRELIDVDRLPAIGVVGYSLGGNLTLKLMGEYGDAPPTEVQAACAVSPTLDLARCVDALERPENWLYQWNFVRGLKGRMRRMAAAWPGRFDLRPMAAIRSVRQFDEAYTAPHHGFDGAADYYHRAASLRVADRIRVPTLIVSAKDDPFIPPDQFDEPAVTGNAAITRVLTEHGGHCGFVEDLPGQDDGYWAERVAIRFLLARCVPGTPARTPAPSPRPRA